MHNYSERFKELISRGQRIRTFTIDYSEYADAEEFRAWLMSSLNLLEIVFGSTASLTKGIRNFSDDGGNSNGKLLSARGVLKAAAEEFERGYLKTVRREVSDELAIDLCLQADHLLSGGYIQPAAVLAAAALEECFRKRAEEAGLHREGNTLTDNVNALKGAQILQGTTAKVASSFGKFRNAALHADWGSISEAEVVTVSGFVKSYAALP